MAAIPMPLLGSVPVLGPDETLAVTQALVKSGLIRPYRPDQAVAIARGVLTYGLGPGVGPTVGSVVYPDEIAYIDDEGRYTFTELQASCSAVAVGLQDAGLREGERLGILGRNTVGFYLSLVGASRAGVDVGYLNTGFTAEQVADVCEREGLKAVAYDEEFAERVPASVVRIPMTPHPSGTAPSVMEMAAGAARDPGKPAHRSKHIILTSGTTGRPKGAARTGGGLDSIIALLSGFGHETRKRHLISAPMFHAWGWSNMMFTMLLSSTIVNQRRFDPEETLAVIERERCEVLVAVPVMVQRIMGLPAEVRRRYDTSCLEKVVLSGSALSGELANAFQDEFGDVVYNLYGSTEAAFATVATPEDLRAAPGTAGRPLAGVQVRVVDDHGAEVPAGTPGSIIVGSGTSFEGYTSGEDKERIGGLVAIGDRGWFDEDGRLFVGSRDDDMVVTGGENVYPVTVENELVKHPDVIEAAVLGAEDREFGQVLVAHVVLKADSALNADDAGAAELRTWSKQHLAPFQVPRRIVFHSELPRNDSGKVLKRVLAEAQAD